MKLENTFCVGDRVRHSDWGNGTVTYVDPENDYLTVAFDPTRPGDTYLYLDYSFFCPEYYGADDDDGLECINELIPITD